MDHANNTLALFVLIQYIPRLFLIFPLNQHITKTTGVIAKTLWIAAAYNLLLYMLASHEQHGICPQLGDNSTAEKQSCEVTCKATLAKCHSKLFPNVTPRPSSTSSISLACLQMLFSMMLLLLTLWKDTSITLENLQHFLFRKLQILANANNAGLIWTQPHTSQRHFLHLLMSFWIRKNDTKQWMRHRQLPPDLQECVRRQWMRYLCKDSRERCRNMGSTDAKWKLADHPKLPKKN
ncbi:hypothetical protein Ahy_A09g044767 isoform L [Arachis hypogaea]|uniref:Uncharacterized protein n=1 Tax=Arachis hypogaea TaxID=3818 RepID=A0A445BKR4_ARAHY|nr:hypothetical protein Ahy_A09g044767 isoform L [Arachis hypogaea]